MSDAVATTSSDSGASTSTAAPSSAPADTAPTSAPSSTADAGSGNAAPGRPAFDLEAEIEHEGAKFKIRDLLDRNKRFEEINSGVGKLRYELGQHRQQAEQWKREAEQARLERQQIEESIKAQRRQTMTPDQIAAEEEREELQRYRAENERRQKEERVSAEQRQWQELYKRDEQKITEHSTALQVPQSLLPDVKQLAQQLIDEARATGQALPGGYRSVVEWCKNKVMESRTTYAKEWFNGLPPNEQLALLGEPTRAQFRQSLLAEEQARKPQQEAPRGPDGRFMGSAPAAAPAKPRVYRAGEVDSFRELIRGGKP